MPNPAAQVRSTLANEADALPPTDLLALVDDFVLDCAAASSEDAHRLISQLEEDLQEVYREGLVYGTLEQIETFLAVLYHLGPVLPSTAIISWFDLVLRPALREPKLPTQAINHAKELIISSFHKATNASEILLKSIGDFRRRLMDLYLLDAFNEGKGEDILEWAELPREERKKKTLWKHNLEDVLLSFGNERPEDLLDEIDSHFVNPSSRLQLLSLLNMFTNAPSFSKAASVLPKHQLMQHLLWSLLFDSSSTVATLGVTLLVKLLPSIAVRAPDTLKPMLPKLLAILARIMCWKERPASLSLVPSTSIFNPDENQRIDESLERELERETNPSLSLHVLPSIQWERLDMTFNHAASLPPSSRNYFTMLYYLYPSNTLRFLRSPVNYLETAGEESPFIDGWIKTFDQDEIRRRSENLVREHNCHPLIIWRDAVVELEEPEFWLKYEMSRIVSEAPMLDVRNLALAMQTKYAALTQASSAARLSNSTPTPHNFQQLASDPPQEGLMNADAATASSTTVPSRQPSISSALSVTDTTSPRFIQTIDFSSGKAVISLQDMINTTIALRSNLDVEVVHPSGMWKEDLWTTNSIPTSAVASKAPSPDTSKSTSTASSPPGMEHPPSTDSTHTQMQPKEDSNEAHVAQAVSGLQREILLLRNDLNFELWLSRENAKHIGRLYQDRILMRSADAERQGLYNKLRGYRLKVNQLENDKEAQKQSASDMKNKYAEWNIELSQRLKELKDEKKGWMEERKELRRKGEELKAHFEAQAKLLADATKEVFELQTQRKANQHKIDRLHDYEAQISQFLKVRKTWDQDFQTFNAREEDIKLMQAQYKQMQMRVDCLEKTQIESDDTARSQRRQIQNLETRIAHLHEQTLENPSMEFIQNEVAAYSHERGSLKSANEKLRDENAELKDELEELKAMVEVLKAQHTGRRGLVGEPKSPVFAGSPPFGLG
ncbi:hypothetical protein CPB83DRAFT_480311 [Crepidotus variabilis]|uniref:Hamartin n=1 Tax=Crepidotus variabilis TaxID=179855 RepID=A0A9P6JV62_9AGAR|nr:hypothetical protein CPB83DRAFT_480311 [Crepidotus variabilis]